MLLGDSYCYLDCSCFINCRNAFITSSPVMGVNNVMGMSVSLLMELENGTAELNKFSVHVDCLWLVG